MSIEKVIIVVPTDFTKVADTAVEHAIGLCKSIANSEVVLLHIIGKEKEKASAEVKLKEQSENLTQKTMMDNLDDSVFEPDENEQLTIERHSSNKLFNILIKC